MQKHSLIKQLILPLLALSFTLVFFSSCHRGYGCPGHIGQGEIEMPEQEIALVVIVEEC